MADAKAGAGGPSGGDGAPSISINGRAFKTKLENLTKHWQENPSLYGNADVLAIEAGKLVDDGLPPSSLVVCTQVALLNYEFPETLFVITKTKAFFLTASKKAALLEPCQAACKGGPITVEILKRSKSENAAHYATVLAGIKEAGASVKLGRPDETPQGTLMSGWREAVDADASVSVVDCSPGLDAFFSVKEDSEVEIIAKAARLSTGLLRRVLRPSMESAITGDKSVQHSAIAGKADRAVRNPAKYGIRNLDADECDLMVPAVIQSGNSFDSAKISAGVCDDETMKFDTIVIGLSGQYENYGASIGRTYIVDPTDQQKQVYENVLSLHEQLLTDLKPGKKISDVITDLKRAADLTPSVRPYLCSTFGHGIGMIAKERTTVLSDTNETVLKPGMVLVVCVSADNVPVTGSSSGDKKFSVRLCDTMVVMPTSDGDGLKEKVLTNGAKRDLAETTYVLQEKEDSEDSDDEDKSKSRSKRAGASTVGLAEEDGRLRSARLREQYQANKVNEEDTLKRQQRQIELFEKQREDALAKIQSGSSSKPKEDLALKNAKEIIAFKSAREFPEELRPCQTYVDKKRECVFVPINGVHVPFHISTIRTVQKSDEGGIAFLRLNFYSTGASLGKDAPPSVVAAAAANPQAIYIRTINLKCRSHQNLNLQARQISAVMKTMRQARLHDQETSNLVKQAALRVDNKSKDARLAGLSMRPPLSGKKSDGTLEAHSNGLRFTASNRREHLDVTYANIKHAIYQPCQKELVVLIHFHLKDPILVNKKRTRDVQFYTEVVEASTSLDGRHRSIYDPDEYEEESRERMLRKKLNQTFKRFADAVQRKIDDDHSSTLRQIDIPSRDAGFYGVPHKEMVFLQPCTDCLVNLTERPPFVLSLDDIQHVHFERVSFQSKNFDMVVIFHEGISDGDEFIRISDIPMAQLEDIKAWLCDTADKTYTEGVANLNWKSLITDVVRDPAFFLDEDPDTGEPKPVGWAFLMGGDSESEEDDEPSESDFSEDLDEEEEEEEDDDDDFDDAVESEEEEEDESDFEDEDEEEGLSWDELHKQAAVADRKRAREEEEASHQPSRSERDRSKGKSKKRRRD